MNQYEYDGFKSYQYIVICRMFCHEVVHNVWRGHGNNGPVGSDNSLTFFSDTIRS